jgi:hypothetical protein
MVKLLDTMRRVGGFAGARATSCVAITVPPRGRFSTTADNASHSATVPTSSRA